jgi:predicted component of viral defense system (DUF524 family)
MEAILGRPSAAKAPRAGTLSVTVDWDYGVTWKERATVLYNASFSRGRPHRYSYSAPLRPDIAIWIHSGSNQELHLMDAKFKLEKLDALLPEKGDGGAADQEDEDIEERRGTFKRGDLYKMHAYRDAIPDAKSVRILYPGTEERFFPDGQRQPSVRSERDGVGALPLCPGAEPFALRETLKLLLEGRVTAA